MQVQKEQRIDCTINFCKGLAIILIIVGHSGLTGYAKDFIYMFHVPLFFFCSGYCFKEKYYNDSLTFIKRKIIRLYVPYVKWSIIFLLVHYILLKVPFYANLFDSGYMYGIKDFLKQSLLVIFTMSKCPIVLGGFWFLKALLLSSILSLFILRIFRSYYTSLLLVFVLLIIEKLFDFGNSITDLSGRVLLGTFFYIVGFVFKKKDMLKMNRWVFTSGLCILLIAAKFFPAELPSVKLEGLIPYMIGAISGIFFIYNLCKLITQKNVKCIVPVFELFGQNTLFVLTWHMLVFKFTSFVLVLICGLDYCKLIDTPIITDGISSFSRALYSIITIILFYVIFKMKRN